MKEKMTYLCPKCGGIMICVATARFLPNLGKYECRTCGYGTNLEKDSTDWTRPMWNYEAKDEREEDI